jgi:hypothetical protein
MAELASKGGMTVMSHKDLIDTCRDLILSDLWEATAMGAEAPAVLLLDPLDPAARAIAEESGRGDEVAAALDLAHRTDTTLVLTWGMPLALIRTLVAAAFPEAPAAIDRAAATGRCLAIVIAAGRLSVHVLPLISNALGISDLEE